MSARVWGEERLLRVPPLPMPHGRKRHEGRDERRGWRPGEAGGVCD